MVYRRILLAAGASLAALLWSCSARPLPPAVFPAVAQSQGARRWIPSAGTSYQIQYSGKLDLAVDAQIYDLDMFDTPASVVAKLHAAGRRVMCYVDVGTWEKWRPDARAFPKSVLGRPDGHWKGERWLDVRQAAILHPIMTQRLELCRRKGFDGVDPDNLDGFENKTGFAITARQQLAYDTWVAQEAHRNGLTAAQKGDNDQVADLVKVYDFAVVEQCYAQHWCDEFTRYTRGNRLVVDVEYGISPKRFTAKTCPQTGRYDETAILKKLQLTAWLVACANH